MKINCPCGNIISDNTDALPQKAHLIPDQEWHPMFDAIDKVIEDVAARRLEVNAAQMAIHYIFKERSVYQCRACGRLFVDDRQHQMHIYTPSSDETCKEILKS